MNTAAVSSPGLITEISKMFGNQCMVLSIEAKRLLQPLGGFYRQWASSSGLDVIEWAKRGVDLGAGEILLTSIDREGTRKGFDVALVKAVSEGVSVPVIASGGMGEATDVITVVCDGGADAVAMADILHYQRATVGEVRSVATATGLFVRNYQSA